MENVIDVDMKSIRGVKKIYLSPSDQRENRYAAGDTDEATQCRGIAAALEGALIRCGFEVKVGLEDSMSRRVEASNGWGADLHLCIHTNAHDGTVAGTRLFCYDLEGEGYRACKAVLEALAPITPGQSDNITVRHFYEVRQAYAPVVYLEAAFHDHPEEAAWIIANKAQIGEAVCRGICDHYGVAYVSPEADLYRVQVGAFRIRENARKLCEELKAAGYADAFVTGGGKANG